MTVQLPTADRETVHRRQEIVDRLRQILDEDSIVEDVAGRTAYDCDAFTMYRALPLVVVLPKNTSEVSAVLKLASSMNVKVVPRGTGTSLSGGSLPLEDAILLVMTKFNQILEIDYLNRCVCVQPGVPNAAITKAISADGFYYAPDPSSQIICSIGGNVGENAGGVHCLKYGLTSNNLLGLEIVLMNGDILHVGGKHFDADLYDLMGLLTGSEGLLAVITEVIVRILPSPELTRAVLLGFSNVASAADCVAEIIANGIVPAGLEMMDQMTINAVEDFKACGYPRDAGALLICELDGVEAEVDYLIGEIVGLANRRECVFVRTSKSEQERLLFWSGRKNAFPAVGRIGPDYFCMDGSIPRGQISNVLKEIGQLSNEEGLRVANVFHAGDGNLHPLILYDANCPGEAEKAERLGARILELCVEVGGALSGEHGVGIEKRDLMCSMFDDDDLDQQKRIKGALDPHSLLNPGKVFPTLHRCAEGGKQHSHKSINRFPELPRF